MLTEIQTNIKSLQALRDNCTNPQQKIFLEGKIAGLLKAIDIIKGTHTNLTN